MDWNIAAAVAEIIGASAVVISLIYLAVQIRGQTDETRLAAMHDISAGFRQIVADFGRGDVAELYVKGIDGVGSFTDQEMFQLIVAAQQAFRLWEEAFYLYEDGRLDGKNWDGMNRQLASFLSTPGFSHVWKIRQQFYGSDFRDMVNALQTVEYQLR